MPLPLSEEALRPPIFPQSHGLMILEVASMAVCWGLMGAALLGSGWLWGGLARGRRGAGCCR